MASYAALDLGGRVLASKGWKRILWLAMAAVAMGGGIWSMHFIAMLAFVLPVPVDYDFKLTAISLLVAILATGAGFYVVAGDPQRRRRLAFGGVLIGTGIVAMHYTGMSAMLMRCSLRYDLLLLIASVLIAIGAATTALWLAFRTRGVWRRLGAAVLMGAAISGMHYTGMAAAIFSLTTPAVAEIGAAGSAHIQLALGIAALTFIILFMALLASAQTLARQRGELIEADPNGVVVVDSHGCIETVNGRLTKLFGYRQVELLGQPVELLLPERYRRSHVALRTGYSASPANRPMGAGRDLQGLRKDGSEFPIEIGLSPITSERGVAVVATVIDITERKAAEEKEKILVRELQHRTNNLLAVVQAIAHESLSGPGSIEQMRSAFDARLQALGRAHRQLVNSNWRGVALKEIVRSSLEPFGARIDMDGADIIFGAKETQDFSLVIHELATNAVKYGALSDANGKIKIGWAVVGNDGDAVLRFQWQERGGPPVDVPKRQGFGNSLLRAAFRDINIDYAREGLTCQIRVPLGKIEFTAPFASDHQAVKTLSLSL